MTVAMTSPERRKAPRMPVGRIAYLNFEEHNGGIILNVSQGGLCFHSIVPVPAGGTVRFWLLERGERIKGEGRLVWMDDSQKRGGLCFVRMSADAREKIWDLASEPRTGVAAASPGSVPGRGRSAGLVRLRVPSPQAFRLRLFRGFSGGLVIGLLISALVAGTLASHRQLGELLVRLGERLGAKPQAKAVVAQPIPAASVPSAESKTAPLAVRPTELRKPPAPVVYPEREDDSLLVVPRLAMPAKTQPESAAPKLSANVTTVVGEGVSAKPPLTAENVTISPPPPAISSPKSLITPLPIIPDKSGTGLPPNAPNRTVVLSETSRPDDPGSAEQMYFEVGKFRQQLWARQETDKLAKLGFPATVLQKGRLWMNSYHVLVGPYDKSEDAAAAHRNLVASGFEARPFERGSRTFALPASLMLHGAQVPVGDCVIRWESYISDVKVKFEQDNYVVATADAKWVSHDPKYEHSATVYVQNRDGSRSLIEVRFQGMDRALVFR
jgi:hypothetical protein